MNGNRNNNFGGTGARSGDRASVWGHSVKTAGSVAGRAATWSGTVNDPGFDTFPFGSAVLEPNFDLDFGQSKVMRNLERKNFDEGKAAIYCSRYLATTTKVSSSKMQCNSGNAWINGKSKTPFLILEISFAEEPSKNDVTRVVRVRVISTSRLCLCFKHFVLFAK